MTVPVNVGDVVDGNYVIERLLGQGGMGAVFVAREERLGRRVAIKVLLDTVAKNPEAVTRFEREARSAAALQSDHVTRVLSVGHLTDGSPYIVMEFLEGEDLANLLAARGALPAAEVVSFMIPACEALAEAHALGIVHRDLKPANLFLARRPTGGSRIKVLDFGISKSASTTSSQALTKTTALMGTPMYMSPEQLREVRNVDGRADVWALGIMMYELLSGQTPFQSEALAELCVLIMTTPHPPLRTRRPDVPPGLEAIVEKCLQKDPAQRFATAQELLAALSTVSLASAPPAPMPIRMATPRMSPRLETADVAGHMRAQAMTEAAGAGPAGAVQTGPGPFDGRGSSPGAIGVPGPMPARPVTFPGTINPVSSTQQPWLPSKGPGFGLIAGVFLAAVGIGGVLLYFAVLRPPASGDPAAAASGGSGLVASSSATAAVATSPPPTASVAASTAPAASASASLATAANGATGTKNVQNAQVSQGGAAGATSPRSAGAGVAALPPPGGGGLALPPPGGPATPSTATAHGVPSAKPAVTPATNPGSLMPGARN